MLQSGITRVVILFFFLGIAFYAHSQEDRFDFNIYTNKEGDSLRYRLLSPDAGTSRKFPLVIFLHGSGERGNDNKAQLKWGVMNFAADENMKMFPAYVIAPQCPANQSWSAFPKRGSTDMALEKTPTLPMKLVLELVQQAIQTLPVDPDRVYITGLSMGGFGTFDAISRAPQLFAAAIPVCGGGDTSKAASFSKLPMWIFTGAEDEVVNPQLSLKMLQALIAAGAKPGFTQYPEVGHFSWVEAYSDPLVIQWLFRQHK